MFTTLTSVQTLLMHSNAASLFPYECEDPNLGALPGLRHLMNTDG
jgi:hypothetical protein